MESEVSLPHSHVPATCSYPAPAGYSPCPPSQVLNIYLNIILPYIPGFPNSRFPAGFLTKPNIHLSSPDTRYMPHLSHSSRNVSTIKFVGNVECSCHTF